MSRARSGLVSAGWLLADAALVALLAGPAQALLLFLLSPDVPLTLGGIASTVFAMLPQIVLVYVLPGPLLVLIATTLAVGRSATRGISLRYLLRFGLLDASILALAAFHQWRSVAYLLPDQARVALSLMTSALALAALVAALLVFVDARRPGRLGAPHVVALALGVVVALSVAGTMRRVKVEPPPPVNVPGFSPDRSLLIVEVPGLSPERVASAVERGTLESVERLAGRGVTLPLAGGELSDAAALHATLITGRTPREHGVLGAVRYRPLYGRRSFKILPRGLFMRPLVALGLFERVPLESDALGALPLSGIADALALPIARVGVELGPRGDEPPSLALPEEALTAGRVPLAEGGVRCREPAAVGTRFFDRPAADLPEAGELAALVRRALEQDLCALEVARALVARGRHPIVHVRLGGYYRVAYRFAGYDPEQPARGVGERELAAYGRVLTRYLRELDPLLGALARAVPEHALTALVSPHGMRPREDFELVLARLIGREVATGTHRGPPEGVIVLAGEGVSEVASGQEPLRLDSVLPTLLWAAGLPAAEDMGPVALHLFEPQVVAETSLFTLPSYGAVPMR